MKAEVSCSLADAGAEAAPARDAATPEARAEAATAKTLARPGAPAREVHLIPERLWGEDDTVIGSDRAWLAPLGLNGAPVWLVVDRACPGLSATPPAGGGAAVLVEPVRARGQHLAVLITFPPDVEAQVNGDPAPRRALLRAGDCFGWCGQLLFHVTIFSRPQIGPPPAPVVHQPCPICRVPFAATDTVLVCGCGQVMHAEATPDRLQCAQTRGTCARCNRPVRLEPHYEWYPDA